jgi:DNA-binding protein HU-beta
MNKGELVEAVQKALGKDTSKRAAEDAVNAVLEAIAKGVKKDDVVQLIGFGTFKVKKRAARLGPQPEDRRSVEDQGIEDRRLLAVDDAEGFSVRNRFFSRIV